MILNSLRINPSKNAAGLKFKNNIDIRPKWAFFKISKDRRRFYA
jgi:hypothetical protein